MQIGWNLIDLSWAQLGSSASNLDFWGMFCYSPQYLCVFGQINHSKLFPLIYKMEVMIELTESL